MAASYHLVLDCASAGKTPLYTLAPMVKDSVGIANQRTFQTEVEFYSTLASFGIDPGETGRQILSRACRAVSIPASEQTLIALGVWTPGATAQA